jgi:hypothetical protein
MDDLSHTDIEYWGNEYLRLRRALPAGTTFAAFLKKRRVARCYAEKEIGRWRENPRFGRMTGHYIVLSWAPLVPYQADQMPTTIDVNHRTDWIKN